MKKWTKDEEEFLKTCCEMGWFYKDIANELDRSISSVSGKSKLMNLISIAKNKTTKQYKAELPINTILLGKYINDSTKILHKHLPCGLEWYVSPSSILGGNICPKCSGNKKKTTEEYKIDLPTDLTILGEYKGALTKIIHKHICGYEWYVLPHNILQGQSCPKCAVHGFNIEKESYTYVIYFKELDIYKVGITNNIFNRIKTFGYKAEIIFYRKFNKGIKSLELEKRWLNNIKELKINTGLLITGNTETFKI